MSRKMSIAREIKIQKLQTKNRMVGETFNPSGITGEQLHDREYNFILAMKNETQKYRKQYWDNITEIIDFRKTNNICASWEWEWEWNVFKRNFVYHNGIVM